MSRMARMVRIIVWICGLMVITGLYFSMGEWVCNNLSVFNQQLYGIASGMVYIAWSFFILLIVP